MPVRSQSVERRFADIDTETCRGSSHKTSLTPEEKFNKQFVI